jgi:hypothetical protein
MSHSIRHVTFNKERDMDVLYNIKVKNGNATVTREPPFDRLHLRTGDKVRFKSDDPKTVIRYRSTSPFESGKVGPGVMLVVGNGTSEPFQVKKEGEHHFDCGFNNVVVNDFAPWGGTDGDDTPVDP